MGLLYDEGDDTPTKIGSILGSIFGICVYIAAAALMAFPLLH